MKTMTKRWIYGAFALFLVVVEVLIALFVHDAVIRPYGGDVLVTILLCCMVRVVWVDKCRLMMPVYVFAFSAVWEFLQILPLVKVVGLYDIAFFRIAMGTSFAWLDILCYGIGCALFWGAERLVCRMSKK